MGYSEIYCALCSISFNMARIRTAQEPEEAALSTSGPPGWVNPLGRDNGECSTEKTGCFYVVRKCEWFKRGISDGHKSDLWSTMFFEYEEGKLPKVGDRLPMGEPIIELDGRIGFDKCDLEHVAGPGCESTEGYVGNRVSAEEMRFCQTAQGLIAKGDDWQPEPDDCQAERESKFFLTGLVDSVPDIESGITGVSPARHGVSELDPADPFGCCYDTDYNAPPFHPSCFGIFMKLSRLRFGRVEIDGLMDYFENLYEYDNLFTETLKDPDAAEGCDQWWNHVPGAEWLAVNPFYVPRLREIFQKAMDNDPSFTHHNSVFGHLSPKSSSRNDDPFGRLPAELRILILNHLGSKDIASLRLVSRTFYDLPASAFYRLIRDEMPWLWEVWDDEPPFFWATVTESDIKANAIMQPLADDDHHEFSIVGHSIDIEEHLRKWKLPKPPLLTTNWYIIYRDVKKHFTDMKGLRNRKRVWTWLGGMIEELAKHLRSD